mmetsp:Transcript_30206/g.54315  ORF Transcript_30206/g.54315 Transcript_30206/m.54315 type:complete len:88 (+) Transcript_30206:40-303(+)
MMRRGQQCADSNQTRLQRYTPPMISPTGKQQQVPSMSALMITSSPAMTSDPWKQVIMNTSDSTLVTEQRRPGPNSTDPSQMVKHTQS